MTDRGRRSLSRASILAVVLGGVLALTGVARQQPAPSDTAVATEETSAPIPDGPSPSPPPADTIPASPQPAASPIPELAATPPWAPGEGELLVAAKQLAAHATQALLTYPHGTDPAAHVRAALGNLDPAAVGLVHPDAASRATVGYVQLGGLSEDAASMMVLFLWERLHSDGRHGVERRVFDVRLMREGTAWALAGIGSYGGPPAAPPTDLPPEARAVLASPRLHLPDSARWDIHRNLVDPAVLRLLVEMAEHHEIHVLTLTGGHPWEVFGTERQSNHSRGLAVDIWAIDGTAIAAQRHEGSPAHRFARRLFDRGVPELGSPWAFDGFGGRSFADTVHSDHLHVAVHRSR